MIWMRNAHTIYTLGQLPIAHYNRRALALIGSDLCLPVGTVLA